MALLAVLAVATPARAETATWVSTYPIQTGGTERIEVAPDASAWAVIDHSRVLKSTDAGTTWQPLSAVPVSGLPYSGPSSGGSSDTHVAPVSAQVALGANGGAYSMTRDGGVSWSTVTVPMVTKPGGISGTNLVRRTGGRYWVAPGGYDVVNGCAVVLPKTPLLSSADGRSASVASTGRRHRRWFL
jgi:hypothetical protein